MRIAIDGRELGGTPLQIVQQMRDLSFATNDVSDDAYIDKLAAELGERGIDFNDEGEGADTNDRAEAVLLAACSAGMCGMLLEVIQ